MKISPTCLLPYVIDVMNVYYRAYKYTYVSIYGYVSLVFSIILKNYVTTTFSIFKLINRDPDSLNNILTNIPSFNLVIVSWNILNWQFPNSQTLPTLNTSSILENV